MINERGTIEAQTAGGVAVIDSAAPSPPILHPSPAAGGLAMPPAGGPAASPAHGPAASPAGSLATPPARHTVWGFEPQGIHDRFWAHVGVQVVRQGQPSQIVRQAELYLLTDPRLLTIFRLSKVMEVLSWVQPSVLFVRLHDPRERSYAERVVVDDSGRFERFERVYDAADTGRLARVVVTPDREIAQLWQSAPDALTAWRRLRRYIPRHERSTLNVDGSAYDQTSPSETGLFLRELLRQWRRPDVTINRAQRDTGQTWVDPTSQVDANAKFVGPVWVGAGRHVTGATTVVGPAILWDEPECRPGQDKIQWLEIEPSEPPAQPLPRASTLLDRLAKRSFDVAFASIAVACSALLYPFICLAIWLEDGPPFFFSHRRETLGGREFPCIKFRSMRKDAEQIKAALAGQNQADGPQFWMEDDPRLTRVGRFIRKVHLDEMPQFLNVLAGHMSIVGPRPSPHRENQYCPEWRAARLSVRPGITGLWQIKRTRQAGSDFQEWIKYDIEYVERRSFWLDLTIVWKTFVMILRRVARS